MAAASPLTIIGHGVDIVEVPRIQRMLEEHGDHFLQRVFTEDERRYAEAAKKRRAERYAVRFACKEAALKALGTGWSSGIHWRDIEVVRTPGGRPGLRVAGRGAEVAAELGITHWLASLSHTSDLALASVLACGSSPP